ncbi:MAG: twin-arginine translocase TatA/TatE family subunit [Solirubrobacterales bacterium]|jgi:sec-independent protein translocase protein TatA|nr:twin-arginine translocase TatA/TatE family subunit [Solirubrobacterales bacterium]
MPIGPLELVIVLIIALLVLGPKRLPDAGRSLGRAMKEFKSAVGGDGDRDERDELPPEAPRDEQAPDR